MDSRLVPVKSKTLGVVLHNDHGVSYVHLSVDIVVRSDPIKEAERGVTMRSTLVARPALQSRRPTGRSQCIASDALSMLL